MKYSCMGDIHVKWWNDQKFTDDGVPLRLKEILDAIRFMCDYSLENDIQNIALLGDINDTKTMVHSRAFSLLKKTLDEYKQLHFHVIAGNHDTVGASAIETAADMLKGPNNITVYEDFTKVGNIDFIPWKKNISEYLETCKGNDILFSHFSLGDVKMSGSSMTLDHAEVDKKTLNKWKTKILGDIHLPQTMKGNIWYTGSPIQFTRSEADEVKRFLVIDTETLKVESIPIESKYRKYHNVILNESSKIEDVKSQLEELKKDDGFISFRKQVKDIPVELGELLDEIAPTMVDSYEDDSDYKIRGMTESLSVSEKLDKCLVLMNVSKDNLTFYKDLGMDIINNSSIQSEL